MTGDILSPEEEFLLAKLRGILSDFEDAPPEPILRAALLRLRAESPEQVAAALPELRQEVLAMLAAFLRGGS